MTSDRQLVDSFSYNLFQQAALSSSRICALSAMTRLPSVSEIEGLNPRTSFFSGAWLPQGRGHLRGSDTGSAAASRSSACASPSAICSVRRRIEHAAVMHVLEHRRGDTEEPLFAGLAKRPAVARYHSLVAAPILCRSASSLSDERERSWLCGIRPALIYGVQFHPNHSTPQGTTIMQNFLPCNRFRRASRHKLTIDNRGIERGRYK